MERGSVELRHLKGFVAVAEELHFGRAATRLHMAQPPLSRMISQLEEHLGVALLDRTRNRVTITEAGQVFYEEAVTVLTSADRAIRVTRQTGRGRLGRLRIGHVNSASLEFLTPVITAFHHQAPGVRLTIRESTSAVLLQALRTNELDAALVRSPVQGSDLDSELMHQEDLVAALPTHHPLARHQRIRIAALADQQFIVFPRSSGPVHDHILTLCHQAGFEPAITEEAHPASSVVLLVAAGYGIALVPAFVQHHFTPPGVTYRPLEPGTAPLDLSLAWRCQETSPTVHAFLHIARHTRNNPTTPTNPEPPGPAPSAPTTGLPAPTPQDHRAATAAADPPAGPAAPPEPRPSQVQPEGRPPVDPDRSRRPTDCHRADDHNHPLLASRSASTGPCPPPEPAGRPHDSRPHL